MRRIVTVKVDHLGVAEYRQIVLDGASRNMMVVPLPQHGGQIVELYVPVDPRVSETNELVLVYQSPEVYMLEGSLYRVQGASGLSTDEIALHIRYWMLRRKRELQRIKRELEALDNLERVDSAQREMIPEAVRLFVWQRDGGTCVNCGSNQKLEFDHIIPVAEGGSNTERNVPLLCEPCNRGKSTRI